jgi:carboxyl-terminal processing protease
VARYYTPSGRSIQAEGIEPDVVIEQNAVSGERAAGISEASLEGHLENEKNAQESAQTPGRNEPRRNGEKTTGEPFSDDVQARMAYQTLRAIAFDREHQLVGSP